MGQTAELGTPALTQGRQIKFTPERIQQIKNLVERGKNREEIAELIGVTVGSLQVTCSRFGISLRRPTFNNGTFSLRQDSTTSPSRGGDSASLQLSKERPEQNTRSGPVAQVQAPTPWQDWVGMGLARMGSGMMMRMLFSLMDTNGDGTISLQEFQAAQERIFKAIDANKDGRLTLEEIEAFVQGIRRSVFGNDPQGQ